MRHKKSSLSTSRVSLSQVSIFSSFQLLQKISPYFAAFFAFKLWFHPVRGISKLLPAFKPATTKSGTIIVNGKKVCYWSAGTGQAILLAHGWGSFSGRFASIGDALLDQGYKVVWFDAPAHGASTGSDTNLYEVVECIKQLETLTGSFDVIIGHSFGGLCALTAVADGLNLDKIIVIGSPSSSIDLVYKFFSILKVQPKTQKHFFVRLFKSFDEDTFKKIEAKAFGNKIKAKVLIIHDTKDKVVTLAEGGKPLEENLSNSKLIVTTGLGHNKILYDSEVIQHCLDFIRE